MNITDDQYETLAALVRLPPPPAVRHDRDDPGRAHRRARPTRAVVDGLRHGRLRRRGAAAGRHAAGRRARSARSSSAASRASRCSPATSTTRTTTAASFRDGWFLTGDRARRDDDGRFFFDGRRSDVLKVAGENVSTVEVEQVLAAHPGGARSRGRRQPDDVRDEVPVGFVVAADPAHPPTVDELHEWCDERLTKSKRPREITLVDELPRTSVGKIRKFLLRSDADSRECHRGADADDHPDRRAARVVRRVASTDVATAVTMPPVIYTVRGVPRVRARGAVRPRVAVRRPRRAASPTSATTSPTTVNGEPIIVARGKDGAVRAFSAICQHRGMQVADGAGNCTKFTCPYHQWSYDLDRPAARRAGDGAHRRLRQEGLPAAGARRSSCGRASCSSTSIATPRRWRRRSPRYEPFLEQLRPRATPSVPARSRSPTCRGTGR